VNLVHEGILGSMEADLCLCRRAVAWFMKSVF